VVHRAGLSFLLALALAPAAMPTVNASAAVHADLNHDKIFDDLESALARPAARPILVSLAAPATLARVRDIERAVGDLGQITRLRLVDAFSARATPRQIRALALRADVRHVEEDARVVPLGVTAQTSFGVTRAREDLPGIDGRGLVAAVIDTGIDTTAFDLPPAKVIGFKDLVNGRTEPYDDVGHGSLVSTILAGSGASGPEGLGVAPAASLVGVKVVDSRGQSSLGLIAQGIQWVVENRAQFGINAINLSLGDPTGCGDGTDVASQAVDAAVAAGITVVAAAGNAGPGTCTIKSPAAAESALTVGAMADTGAGGFSQAWFSSRGPTADGRIKPDVSAPGVSVVIPAPGGGLVAGTGTSAAAPFVTGTALLMLQVNPNLTPGQIKDAIERTAVDWGVPGRDVDYGSGRLDAYAALKTAGAALATPPAVPRHRTWGGTLVEGQNATTDVDVADSGYPLALTMTGPSSGFDLSLRDQSGAEVGTETAQPVASRQEDISLTAPAPGHYTVVVLARSGGGDFTVDASGGFAPADNTAPELTVDTIAAFTNDATPVLHGTAGTALDDFPGVVVRVTGVGDAVRRFGAVPMLGRWSVETNAPLPDGTYTVEAEQGDAAGNVSRTPARTFVVDTTAPVVSIQAAPVGVVNTPRPTFAFESEPGANLECRIDAAGQPSGSFEPCASPVQLGPLADGTYRFVVRATDMAGNVGAEAASAEFTVDTVAPEPQTPLSTPAAAPGAMTPVVAPPRIVLTVPRQRLAAVLRSGLSVRLDCTQPCHATLVLAQGTRVVARRTVAVKRATVRTTLLLSAKARKALARARRTTLTLTASAPAARTVIRRVTLTR
jgi:serine protease AprX